MSNKYLNFTSNRFRGNETNKNKKLFINNLNNQNISNGETHENENEDYNKLKDNYELIRQKLLLISKKEKKSNSIKEKNIFVKKKSISNKLDNYFGPDNNKEKKDQIKEYKEYSKTFRSLDKRRTSKSKTIFLKKFEGLRKTEKNYMISSLIKKKDKNIEDSFKSRNTIKRPFSNHLKNKNKYNNTINQSNTTKTNFHLPSLNFLKTPKTDKVDSLNFLKIPRTERAETLDHFDNKKSLYKSCINRIKEKEPNMIIKKNSCPKRVLNFGDKKNQNMGQNINIKKSYFSRIQRKKSFSDFNSEKSSNKISNKILKSYKFKNKKNKFLSKLKQNLKDEHKNNVYEDLTKEKKKEKSACFEFIENKINSWNTELPLNNIDNDQKIVFNGEENMKSKRKREKYIKIILKDYLKRILSTDDILNIYFTYHKGIIEQNILKFIQNQYFDLSLPSYIFQKDYNKICLNKIQKKDKKILLKKKSLQVNKMKNFSNSNNLKRSRRFSCLEQLKTKFLKNNGLFPLSNTEKKSLLYLYYLDIDLDNINNNENIESEETNSFLKILRGNVNKTETQDLLINKFISIFIKKNGTKNKVISYKKKNSMKINNLLINKTSTESIKSNKSPLFKDNFFSRNEVKRSTSKIEKIKNKKSLLEYNLLFDPNLSGYNNLITDADIIFEPNTKRTIIQKRKKKELQELNNRQLNIFFISSGGMKTDKNIIVMKTLDLKNQYNHKNRGNINSLTSSIKDCNYDSFVKFYKACNCGPNAIDNDGNSLLSLAVKSSCLEIVNFLLDEKANPNLQNVSLFIN